NRSSTSYRSPTILLISPGVTSVHSSNACGLVATGVASGVGSGLGEVGSVDVEVSFSVGDGSNRSSELHPVANRMTHAAITPSDQSLIQPRPINSPHAETGGSFADHASQLSHGQERCRRQDRQLGNTLSIATAKSVTQLARNNPRENGAGRRAIRALSGCLA